MGGSAMTEVYTSVVLFKNMGIVYFNGTLAYIAEVNDQFQQDMIGNRMRSIKEAQEKYPLISKKPDL